MEITVTPTQSDELKILIHALTNVQNQGSTSGEVTIGSTKVEYDTDEVKFTISD